MVEYCDAPIKSIEIQLVRVETCGCAEGFAKDGNKHFYLFLLFADGVQIYRSVVHVAVGSWCCGLLELPHSVVI